MAQLLEQVRLADTGGNLQSEGVTFHPNGSVVSNDDVDLSSAKANGTFSIDLEDPGDVGSSTHGALHGLSLSASSAIKDANVNGHASFDEDLVREASGDQGAYVPEVGTDHVSFGEATLQGHFFEDRNWDTNEGICLPPPGMFRGKYISVMELVVYSLLGLNIPYSVSWVRRNDVLMVRPPSNCLSCRRYPWFN